jgi:hypothetical protein
LGGIGGLWVDFCEWMVGRDSVLCPRQTFERLLDVANFLCAEGMVSGLILRKHIEGERIDPEVKRLYAQSTRPEP